MELGFVLQHSSEEAQNTETGTHPELLKVEQTSSPHKTGAHAIIMQQGE